jgi:hypothetical protein
MSSKEVSGKGNRDPIIQLARMFVANPWLKFDLLYKHGMKGGRSLVERQIVSLVEHIGPDRQFSLTEVVELLLTMANSNVSSERLLVAPAEILDFIPLGKRVGAIPSYLEGIVRKAEREVLLLAPFWDMSTLTDLLRCTSAQRWKPELVLLLVHMGRRLPRVQDIADEVLSIWPGMRVRIFFHLVSNNNQTSYPHAKCLVVDRSLGYLGSANFTGKGMKGHFEVGMSLSSEVSKTLGDLLQYLWSQTDIFTLAWDTAGFGSAPG